MNGTSSHPQSVMVVHPHLRSPDKRWVAAAPLRDHLELGAYDRAPGTARGHARNVMAEWRLGRLWDVAELVISELLTNSVRATEQVAWSAARPPVRLWLLADPRRVCVLAWDAVPVLPAPREAGALEETGRGLAIVDALSAEWGCFAASAPHGGKVTWSLIGGPWRDHLPR
jgi:anti-sigma regulatory factor (Ser/Thr protein kinase)